MRPELKIVLTNSRKTTNIHPSKSNMNTKRIPKINDIVRVNAVEISPAKDCKILSIVLDSIFVRPKFSRQDFEIKEDQIVSWVNEEILTGKEKETIIRRLVKEEFLKSEDFHQLHNQLHILKRLIVEYPNLDFWRNFSPPTRVVSLAQYMGANKDALRFQYNQATLDLGAKEQVKEVLSEEKIGEDIIVKKRPKNMLDLIDSK